MLAVGSSHAECVRIWSVTANKPLYKLATGNNAVVSLVWDTSRQTLYAATSCPNLDRNSFAVGYRPFNASEKEKRKARERRTAAAGAFASMGQPMNTDGEDPFPGRGWPSRASHKEDAFGEAVDTGEHAICAHLSAFV